MANVFLTRMCKPQEPGTTGTTPMAYFPCLSSSKHHAKCMVNGCLDLCVRQARANQVPMTPCTPPSPSVMLPLPGSKKNWRKHGSAAVPAAGLVRVLVRVRVRVRVRVLVRERERTEAQAASAPQRTFSRTFNRRTCTFNRRTCTSATHTWRKPWPVNHGLEIKMAQPATSGFDMCFPPHPSPLWCWGSQPKHVPNPACSSVTPFYV